MKDDEFDIGYWLLDDELIDADDRRCGRVDDVELDGELGEPATIVAILTGAGAMRNRLPERLRPLWERLFGTEVVRVPWDEVEDIDVAVRLKRGGRDLGLGLGDDRWGWAMRRLPDS